MSLKNFLEMKKMFGRNKCLQLSSNAKFRLIEIFQAFLASENHTNILNYKLTLRYNEISSLCYKFKIINMIDTKL